MAIIISAWFASAFSYIPALLSSDKVRVALRAVVKLEACVLV